MSARRGFHMLVMASVVAFLGLSLASAQAQSNSEEPQSNSEEPVVNVSIGDQVLGFSERPRLLQLYQAADLAPANYWASSRLISAKQVEQLAQKRQHVLQRLAQLERVARSKQLPQLAAAAQGYAQQIPQWPLLGAEWIGRTRIDESLEVQSGVDVERHALFSSFSAASSDMDANPLLPAGNYRLLPPKNLGPWQVTVVSAEGRQQFEFDESATVRSLLQRAGAFAANYDLSEVELIALTGLAARTQVAYYNDGKALPPVHGLILIDLDLSDLDAEWQNLNQQISALARYWNPQS